ncbi:venom acid phosphatase Acph-1-like [Trichogramma pretiosum]|uniref:venom acid phosphatase Acph-1-like n=1 Tax=Trichogramma pretiosum TaxID=7493 RepID=UPI000C71BC43|nr:venom acid phosphatase Acph-1-like [Trichogramma pretiosum]
MMIMSVQLTKLSLGSLLLLLLIHAVAGLPAVLDVDVDDSSNGNGGSGNGNASRKLQLIQVIFRHGDRVPDRGEIYDSDPYTDEFWKPLGYGKLTKVGERREFELGRMLRRRYDDFLGDYESDRVYSFTTDMNRTKLSLKLVLNGLYNNETNWNENGNTLLEEFSVDCVPDGGNVFRHPSKKCSKFGKLYKEALDANEPKLDKYRELFDRIENSTHFKHEYKIKIGSRLYRNIRSALALGLPMPGWCSEKCYDDLRHIAGINFGVYVHAANISRITVGPSLEIFLKNMRDSDEKSSANKIYLYSAHDYNIATISKALEFEGIPDFPDFGSAIMIEKRKDENDNSFVKMLMWTGVSEQLITLKLPDCDIECPLERFRTILKPLMPKAQDKKCYTSKAKNPCVNVNT